MALMITAFIAGVINLMLVCFVLFREEKKKTNRIFFFLGLSLAAWNFSSLGIYFASTDTTAFIWIRFFYLSLVFVPSVFFHFVLTIIDDHRHFSIRLRQIGYGISYILLLGSGIGFLSHDIRYLKGYYYPVASRADIVFITFFILYGIYGVYLLTKRRNQTNNPLERKQLTYFFMGSYLVLLGISTNLLGLFGLDVYPFGHLATAVYPLIATYAIVKHKLIDIELPGLELLLRRIKFYLISAGVFILFGGTLFGLERLAQHLIGYYTFWTTALIITVLAFVLQPIRRVLQTLVDSNFFRRKTGQIKMFKEMLTKIGLTFDKETLLDTLLNGVVNIMYISNAAVILLEPEQEEYEIAQAVGIDAIKKKTNKFSHNEGIIPYLKNQINQEYFFIDKLPTLSKLSKPSKDVPPVEVFRSIKRDFERLDATVFIPLRCEQELVGVLSLGRKMSGEGYGHKDLLLIAHLGQKAGMDLKRNNLYRKKTDYLLEVIQSLILAIEEKSTFIQEHSKMVGRYAELIARELGLGPNEVENAKQGGLLHGLGYIGVCEQILSKRGHLTPAEFENVKSHVIVGARIVAAVNNNQEIISGVKYHHERIDGSGYPEALAGNDIPLIARIIAAADVYIAMISDRPYRRGFYREDVLAEMKRHCGYEFEAKIVQALERILKKERELRISPYFS